MFFNEVIIYHYLYRVKLGLRFMHSKDCLPLSYQLHLFSRQPSKLFFSPHFFLILPKRSSYFLLCLLLYLSSAFFHSSVFFITFLYFTLNLFFLSFCTYQIPPCFFQHEYFIYVYVSSFLCFNPDFPWLNENGSR